MVAVKELSAVVAVAADEMEFSVLLRLRSGGGGTTAPPPVGGGGGSCCPPPPPASSSSTAADLDSWDDCPPHDREKGSALLFELVKVAVAVVPLWT
mmetsp:Transcript_2588/g.3699  ORF Transcript_2588/g.3699 Transcript_2588/m.3699 type:complete len:96 (-) Transcript_2588:453-740(-)